MKKILKSNYERLVRTKRRAAARLIFNWAKKSQDTIISSPGQQVMLSVMPRGSKEVFITDLKRGTYRLEIQYYDEILTAHRKSLIVFYEASSGERSHDLAARLGVNLGDKRAFTYMGGGRQKKGKTHQIQDINVTHALHWLRITFHSPQDRFINIDKFEINKIAHSKKSDVPTITARPALSTLAKNWLKRCPIRDDINYIVYADIDMNIVDGSSVWLSSMISILASNSRTLVIAKSKLTSDIITSNILHEENVVYISPDDLKLDDHIFTIDEAVELLRHLDDGLPHLERIFIRGLNAAYTIFSDRQFYNRAGIYITNFYNIENNERIVSDDVKRKVNISVLHSKHLLAQTKQISDAIFNLTHIDRQVSLLPPPVPTNLTLETIRLSPRTQDIIRIGYAGKIVPQWGVDILLNWVKQLQDEGLKVETYIVANRMSDGYGKKKVPGYAAEVRKAMKVIGAIHYSSFNRSRSMGLMSQMDFVWCYRPAALEENTLELSTKLVEMVSLGKPCLAYPNSINKDSLGDNYPFFVESYDGFRDLVCANQIEDISNIAKKIKRKHALGVISKRIGKLVCSNDENFFARLSRNILFSGHDMKFVDAFVSDLKSSGASVSVDRWEWGEACDIEQSKALRDWADVVFCEWGLANAVWHSNNKKPGSRLIVRIHLQEINPRARKFGPAINSEAVDRFVFVSERVRDEAIRMFDWPKDKTRVISNYVLDEEYTLQRPKKKKTVTLGMIGIVPSRKRFDRAIELLKSLLAEGHDAYLKIKGPRPEELPFMHAPGRVGELEYYYKVYAEIEKTEGLFDCIKFEGWGNDVALWYRDVDFILSPSDFESFHYALADGVLSGCWPLIWPWDEAVRIYDQDWIVSDNDEALAEVKRVMNLTIRTRQKHLKENRELIISRYGHKKIFSELTKEIVTLEENDNLSEVV